jgi:2-polyprenyl-3-methyl-5-hydroxy-6-metoxy-1,4-benzoquinol methylase
MDMNDIENNESVREGYQKLGVEDYYKEKALTYSNPHEIKIEKLMNIFFNKYMKLNEDSKILDLCCGSGEITRILENLGCKNIKGLDPFTSELYKSKTNKDCIELNFKDIANGKLKEQFDVIFCSFALHLAEESLLPNILYNLSQISNNLVILTPHKKPDIKLYYELDLELYHEKIRLRKYKKIN